MPYTLNQADVESVTDEELAKGTGRLLPKEEDIPLEHWGWFKGVERSIYFRLIEQLYIGEAPPAGEISFNPGFTGAGLKRFLDAHLRNIHAEYQHRVAGLAYALSIIMTIKEPPCPPTT
jgi:hypothetical protein